MLEDSQIPWSWAAGSIGAVVIALVTAVRYLFKAGERRQNKELERRDTVLDRLITTHETGFKDMAQAHGQGLKEMSTVIREGQREASVAYERVAAQLTALTRERDRQVRDRD